MCMMAPFSDRPAATELEGNASLASSAASCFPAACEESRVSWVNTCPSSSFSSSAAASSSSSNPYIATTSDRVALPMTSARTPCTSSTGL